MTWWQWLLICTFLYLFIGIRLGKATAWSYRKVYNLRRHNIQFAHWYEIIAAKIFCPFYANNLFVTSLREPNVYGNIGINENEYYVFMAFLGLPCHCVKLGCSVLIFVLYVIYQLFTKLVLETLWKPREVMASLANRLKSLYTLFKHRVRATKHPVSKETPDAKTMQALSIEDRIAQIEQRIAQSPDGQLLAQLRMQLMREQEGTVPYRGVAASTTYV